MAVTRRGCPSDRKRRAEALEKNCGNRNPRSAEALEKKLREQKSQNQRNQIKKIVLAGKTLGRPLLVNAVILFTVASIQITDNGAIYCLK
ncbi:UNVERIFIED_CONTAM: hypothetical protein FKN15_046728 [Acipenser sinensis]